MSYIARKSYIRNRLVPKEWPWPLFRGRIEVMSTIALHSTLNISETVIEIEAWFQRTANRKWHMGYQMVTWPMTSRCCEAVRSAILVTARLFVYFAFVFGDGRNESRPTGTYNSAHGFKRRTSRPTVSGLLHAVISCSGLPLCWVWLLSDNIGLQWPGSGCVAGDRRRSIVMEQLRAQSSDAECGPIATDRFAPLHPAVLWGAQLLRGAQKAGSVQRRRLLAVHSVAASTRVLEYYSSSKLLE